MSTSVDPAAAPQQQPQTSTTPPAAGPGPVPAAVGVAAAIAEKLHRNGGNGHGNGNGGGSNGGNGNGHGNGGPTDHHSATPQRPWSAEESAKLYSIRNWGQGYFSINDDGHVAVHPTQEPAKSIDLKKLVDDLRERDIQLPCLIRFTDILKNRVNQIHAAFERAITDHDYRGEYRCVYPF